MYSLIHRYLWIYCLRYTMFAAPYCYQHSNLIFYWQSNLVLLLLCYYQHLLMLFYCFPGLRLTVWWELGNWLLLQLYLIRVRGFSTLHSKKDQSKIFCCLKDKVHLVFCADSCQYFKCGFLLNLELAKRSNLWQSLELDLTAYSLHRLSWWNCFYLSISWFRSIFLLPQVILHRSECLRFNFYFETNRLLPSNLWIITETQISSQLLNHTQPFRVVLKVLNEIAHLQYLNIDRWMYSITFSLVFLQKHL